MRETVPVSAGEFAALMARFGPFPSDDPAFPIGIAVSGGADSLCLALLMRRWRRAVQAFVVDHGLRPESADEARMTIGRLQEMGVPALLLTLTGLDGRRAIQSGARAARYAALDSACKARGILDLALGHHEDDQIETLTLRRAHGSTAHGMAGMARSRETPELRYLRPLLGISSARLRITLRDAGCDWIEDPSNRNRRFERVRIRQDLTPGDRMAARGDLARYGAKRDGRQSRLGALAGEVLMDPLGFALLGEKLPEPDLLARLWQIVSGAAFPPSPRLLAALHRAPRPATLGGALLARSGRLGRTWVLMREPAAITARTPVAPGLLWDRRFEMAGSEAGDIAPFAAMAAAHGEIGPLGREASDFRSYPYPFRILAGLPALRIKGRLVAVPCLEDPGAATGTAAGAGISMRFSPPLTLTDRSEWGDDPATCRPGA